MRIGVYLIEYGCTVYKDGTVAIHDYVAKSGRPKLGRIAKHCLSKTDNYIRVNLPHPTGSVGLHRLLAIAFIHNPNNYKIVNHKNGIGSDFSLENLEWCSQSQNIKHAYSAGLMRGAAKLTKNQVIEIRELLKNPKKGNRRAIAKKYNISYGTIGNIHKYQTWKTVKPSQ